ncbi:MAG: hypothetical protein Q7J16_13185 [Candidatus Cloacimonadales bacterium]|nr:hypothetical protein [Candidatus Cloacimonadales bacterium]
MKKTVLFLVILAVSFAFAQAQTLDETLESLSGQAAESYVAPIVSAFGTNLNGVWFHRAPKNDFFGLNVEFGVVFMASMFPADDKSFNATGSFQFTATQAGAILANSGINSGDLGYNELVNAIVSQDIEIGIHGATIIGDPDEHVMIESPQQTITVDVAGNPLAFDIASYGVDSGIGGLVEMDMLPLAAPQLKIGTIFGTKATFRYLPPYKIPDLGEFKYFGFGIQHNPKAWLKAPIPFQICLSYFTQTMSLGKAVTATSTAFGINASKTFGFKFLSITPYAGYMLESSNMIFKYTYEIGDVNGVPAEPLDVKFDIDGKNKNRLTLGATFRLGVFNINADYNIGKYDSMTAGFAIGF